MDGWTGTLRGREDPRNESDDVAGVYSDWGAAFQAAIVLVEDNCRVARGAIVIVDDAAEYLPTLNRAGVMRLSTRNRGLLPNTLMGASTSVVVINIRV